MRRAAGFTLIEMAVSLAIIALLLGVLMVPLNTQIDQQRINETNKQLTLISRGDRRVRGDDRAAALPDAYGCKHGRGRGGRE